MHNLNGTIVPQMIIFVNSGIGIFVYIYIIVKNMHLYDHCLSLRSSEDRNSSIALFSLAIGSPTTLK